MKQVSTNPVFCCFNLKYETAMNDFQNFILNYAPLTISDWKEIEPCLRRRVLQPGELILREGQICRNLWFLESGFMRFFVMRAGNDISKFFTEPPYLFTSQRSFNQQISARENIEALEESIVWEISREDSVRLLALKNWNTFARNLTQEVQFFTEVILEDLQNKTAEDRYREMLKTGSSFLQKVPLKHLASFLGIAPQSLSRIRKKIMLEPTNLT